MAFRDSFDKCPRCSVQLEDARSARGCAQCGGVFIEEPILTEMLLHMLPPPPRAFGMLRLASSNRAEPKIGCPTCSDPMDPGVIHDVELDRCPKHGIWFDPDELRVTLYRVAQPSSHPPFDELVVQPARFVPPPKPSIPITPGAPIIRFEITPPSGIPRTLSVQLGVIKVGKVSSAHLQITDDETISRLHAIIDADDEITIIDLGSTTGTFVNGAKVNKARLKLGDEIKIGGTTIRIVELTGR